MTKIEYLQLRGLIINEFSFEKNSKQVKISLYFVTSTLLTSILIAFNVVNPFIFVGILVFMLMAIFLVVLQQAEITKKDKLLKVLKDCFEKKLTIKETLEKPEFVEMFFKPQEVVNQFSQPD